MLRFCSGELQLRAAGSRRRRHGGPLGTAPGKVWGLLGGTGPGAGGQAGDCAPPKVPWPRCAFRVCPPPGALAALSAARDCSRSRTLPHGRGLPPAVPGRLARSLVLALAWSLQREESAIPIARSSARPGVALGSPAARSTTDDCGTPSPSGGAAAIAVRASGLSGFRTSRRRTRGTGRAHRSGPRSVRASLRGADRSRRPSLRRRS